MPPSDVLVTVRFFDDEAAARLEARGHKVVRADIAYDALDSTITPAVAEALERVQGWIIGTAPVTREVLERYPHLKVVARRGVGFDTVDVSAIKALGRVLTNTPGGNEPAVADHAIGLMLAVGKRICESHAKMRGGDWKAIVGTELHGKTVGLIGFGRIGRLVAKRLAGFDAQVLVTDPFLYADQALAAGVERCSLPELIKQADFVSLHVPLTDQTRYLINTETLALMKPTAILVNTSRGELIDEAALLQALGEKRLLGAGLDVFEAEHEPTKRNLADALLELPNVVATPHTAASTRESLQRANATAADCVAAVLEGVPVHERCVVADGRAKP
jgi:D-3-phosphoglycerate dehydrogenase